MISSVRQAHEEFYKKFFGIKISYNGEEVKVPLRYSRLSSRDYVEEWTNQKYPCIVVHDFAPILRDNWYVDSHPYYSGVDPSNAAIGYLTYRPVWMEFRYDVSVASKSYTEFLALQDYFVRNYLSEVRFLYNQKLTGTDMVGDVVPYSVRATDIPRTDGVFETNYEFTCYVWVHSREEKIVELVERAIIDASPTNEI